MNNSGHIISISSDKMGSGSDELGEILMKGFINTIVKTDPLPQKIIFYNAGALLVTKDSPVLETLKELENSGIEILVCGTCADYFNVKDKVAVGSISNMPTILESLTSAPKVVTP